MLSEVDADGTVTDFVESTEEVVCFDVDDVAVGTAADAVVSFSLLFREAAADGAFEVLAADAVDADDLLAEALR